MDKKIIAEAAQELLDACSCCVELKTAAQNFLEAMDTPAEQEYAEKLVAEAKADVMTNEQVIAAMDIPEVKAHLGDELASMIKAHAEELKANGVEYCDCPACAAGMKIIKA